MTKTNRMITIDQETDLWLRMNKQINFSELCNNLANDLMKAEEKDEDIMSIEYDIEELQRKKENVARELHKKKAILMRKQRENEEKRQEYFNKVSEEADALRRTILE